MRWEPPQPAFLPWRQKKVRKNADELAVRQGFEPWVEF